MIRLTIKGPEPAAKQALRAHGLPDDRTLGTSNAGIMLDYVYTPAFVDDDAFDVVVRWLNEDSALPFPDGSLLLYQHVTA